MRGPKPLLKFAEWHHDVFSQSGATTSSQTNAELDCHVASALNGFERLEEMDDRERTSGKMLSTLQGLVENCSRISTKMAKVVPRLEDSHNLPLTFRVVGKLARYREVVNFLVRAARRLSPFRQVQVSQVTLAPSPTDQADVDAFTSGIIQESLALPSPENPLRRLRLSSLSTATEFLCNRPTNSFPVHAEIQLLVHHELQNGGLPPRMICSNKLACFLCHLFFQMHGKFLTPGTHGRIYEKWALPKAIEHLREPSLGHMRATLSDVIQNIESRLLQLLETRREPKPMPCESLLGSSLTLAPTLVMSPSMITNGPPPRHISRDHLSTTDEQQPWSSATSLVSSSTLKDAGDLVSLHALVAHPREDRRVYEHESASTPESWSPGEERTAMGEQLARTKLTERSPYFERTTKNMSLLFAYPKPFTGDDGSLSTKILHNLPESLDLNICRPSLPSQTIAAGEEAVDLATIRTGEEKTVSLTGGAWKGHVLVQCEGETLLLTLRPTKSG